MSVLKSRRNKSEAEFIRNARELQIYSIQKCAGFPKRYTFYIGQAIAQCATRIYHFVKCANSIYPLNQHEAQIRRDYFLRANAELNSLVSQIEVCEELFKLETQKIEYWAEIIDKEERLIKGVMKKDRERYKRLPNIS